MFALGPDNVPLKGTRVADTIAGGYTQIPQKYYHPNAGRNALGLIGGNESVYINHSKKPNLEAVLYRRGVWFRALSDIAKGEELTFDYGFDPKEQAKLI